MRHHENCTITLILHSLQRMLKVKKRNIEEHYFIIILHLKINTKTGRKRCSFSLLHKKSAKEKSREKKSQIDKLQLFSVNVSRGFSCDVKVKQITSQNTFRPDTVFCTISENKRPVKKKKK